MDMMVGSMPQGLRGQQGRLRLSAWPSDQTGDRDLDTEARVKVALGTGPA